ncbi:hypothetical protein GGS24DRAFT_479820 [Hypoxylon argillaceum]|nr:hypothetical protein GGS24DRAFT_479820 [Hypoxylon argillaceum]
MPFGCGGRICLGKALATMEARMLAAAIYCDYESPATPGCPPASMEQCSRHSAIPRFKTCSIAFRRLVKF